nr:cytochrome C [Denitromonas sp.]
VPASAAPQRITELPKWVREHREVSPREWTRKEIASKVNCVACHVDAERGYFEDD